MQKIDLSEFKGKTCYVTFDGWVIPEKRKIVEFGTWGNERFYMVGKSKYDVSGNWIGKSVIPQPKIIAIEVANAKD